MLGDPNSQTPLSFLRQQPKGERGERVCPSLLMAFSSLKKPKPTSGPPFFPSCLSLGYCTVCPAGTLTHHQVSHLAFLQGLHFLQISRNGKSRAALILVYFDFMTTRRGVFLFKSCPVCASIYWGQGREW